MQQLINNSVNKGKPLSKVIISKEKQNLENFGGLPFFVFFVFLFIYS